MQQERLNILFAGGGTGGHLFPAVAVADEVKKIKPEAEITFVGTKGGIGERVVPIRGYKFVPIWVGGFKRKLTLEIFLFPVKLVVALMQSFLLMRRLRPTVVVGTGGYVCGPVVYMGSVLGIPTLIQEQNSYPGFTTRFLSSRVDQVHISFESSKRFFKRARNVQLSGNPTRATLGSITRAEAAGFFGLDVQKKTLLVFGGSLGARSINRAVLIILSGLMASDIQVIWQTGENDYDTIIASSEYRAEKERGAIKVFKFIERMEYAYSACDLALCRAGATTVAELTRAGVPSVLIPYPYATADHQTENAKAMVDSGTAIMIADNTLSGELLDTLQELLADQGRLKQMSERALSISKPKAAATIAQAVIGLAKIRDGSRRESV
ncbi:MAG: undecaprenyldiphospho-muramoylpentapeptide beta-N-acetylglucosaminyltransferase [Ignavibacteria bacterium]|nr:undecaprenyldiphospho-muramoylpentapeptide beta-N-acetylglucosaminyltransferase [Ignavibacteria bacterium]